MPQDTPALYSLMNYAGLKQGTFYPMGGFGKLVESFEKIAIEQGVKLETNANVERIGMHKNAITHLHLANKSKLVDAVIGAADYYHIEQNLLEKPHRMYDEKYWESRTFAPSSLIFYLGISKKLKKLAHHNLFFDEDFGLHAQEIYKSKKWPTKPLFYTCCPSKTDISVAPEGFENLFLLMPIAVGLADTTENTNYYFELMMSRLEKFVGENIRDFVVYKKEYSVSNFKTDYNAYKGNAYGLANTLFQTAVFKPKMKSTKVDNLFFAGQLTTPGPGVPPSIISGQVAANELLKKFKIK
jgi:phytoene desaturase